MSRQRISRTTQSTNSSPQRSRFAPPPVIQPKAKSENGSASLPERNPTSQSVDPLARLKETVDLQAKLTIGQPNDRYEQEADRVARNVVQGINSPSIQSAMQQQSVSDNGLQMKPRLQRKTALEGGTASTEVESAISRARGGGQALDSGLQQSMGQAMGADFSGVKVHTDSQSDRLNRSIQARAFTTGNDVFFKKGEYNPGSKGGQELIAHELTHVVQQGQAPAMQTKLTQTPTVSFPALQQQSQVIQRDDTENTVAKLKLCADVETSNRSKLGILDILSADVGHTFLQLSYENAEDVPETMRQPTQNLVKKSLLGSTMGFYPLIHREITNKEFKEQQGYTPGSGASENKKHKGFSIFPKKWVPGRVEEPDSTHAAKITKTYDLTQTQVNQVLEYAESKKNAKYNLYKYNCTNFAIEGVAAAGFSPPSAVGGYRSVMLPNGLYKTLYQLSQDGDESVGLTPLKDGESHDTDKKTTKKSGKSAKKSGKKKK